LDWVVCREEMLDWIVWVEDLMMEVGEAGEAVWGLWNAVW